MAQPGDGAFPASVCRCAVVHYSRTVAADACGDRGCGAGSETAWMGGCQSRHSRACGNPVSRKFLRTAESCWKCIFDKPAGFPPGYKPGGNPAGLSKMHF